jgi:biopolymer transport protein ExbB
VRAARAVIGLFAGLACLVAQAQVPGTEGIRSANTHQELQEAASAARLFQQAEIDRIAAEFRALPANQQQTDLQAAETRRRDAQRRTDATQAIYSANETEINAANRQLIEAGDASGLSQIGALARQAASEAAVVLQQSLITSQFTGTDDISATRERFLRDFGSSRRLPTVAQLERLWYEAQREMTASGEVASYVATIAEPGGSPRRASIVRIGPFTASTEGNFLSYSPVLEMLGMLPREMPRELEEIAAEFEQATSGYVAAVVDPTRGVMLDLYVERPTFMERIELGEWVGYIIIAIGFAGCFLFLIQLAILISIRLKLRQQLKEIDSPKANNPLGRVLLAFKGDSKNIEEEAEVAELRISEAMLREIPKLERFQAFLKLGVAAGPLLGLIGTVIGMIITFQSITETGSSDPRLMATGIGQAMIATVLGLGIAIPLLFGNALLSSRSRGVVQLLEEQSAGILAESIEKKLRRA